MTIVHDEHATAPGERLGAAGEPSLRRLTPEVTANAEIFVVTAPDLQDLERIRLVLEMVTTVFDRNRALFAGTLA